MVTQTTKETQTTVDAWAILEGILEDAGKPISNEYLNNEGDSIDILAECLNSKVGELSCQKIDESIIHAHKITQVEIDKYSSDDDIGKHWSGLFSRIMAGRRAANKNSTN
jgi:hypothetical protein